MTKLAPSRVARFAAGKEWPDIHRSRKYAAGAFWYSSAGHGGTVVLLERFSEASRTALREAGLVERVLVEGGRSYYGRDYRFEGGIEVAVGEEDVGWAAVLLADEALIRGYFEAGKEWLGGTYETFHASVVSSVKDWYPDFYTALTGETLEASESYILTKRAFEHETRDRYVTTAAFGSWHEAVPEGFVGVAATLGGRGSGSKDERWFLIPVAEYDARGAHGFVVDELAHPAWDREAVAA